MLIYTDLPPHNGSRVFAVPNQKAETHFGTESTSLS